MSDKNPTRIVYRWYNDDESTRFCLYATGELGLMTGAKESYVISVLRPEYAEALVSLAKSLDKKCNGEQ